MYFLIKSSQPHVIHKIIVSFKKLSNILKVTVKKWFQAHVSLILKPMLIASGSLGFAEFRDREILRLA